MQHKLRLWLSLTWSALLAAVTTYGISSKDAEKFAMGIIFVCVGWACGKIISEGFHSMISLIEYDETESIKKKEEDEE